MLVLLTDCKLSANPFSTSLSNDKVLIDPDNFTNPIDGNGILYVYSGSNHSIEITFFDMSGKNQFYQKEKILTNENVTSLKTGHFEPGVYIYLFNIDRKLMLIEKLLKKNSILGSIMLDIY